MIKLTSILQNVVVASVLLVFGSILHLPTAQAEEGVLSQCFEYYSNDSLLTQFLVNPDQSIVTEGELGFSIEVRNINDFPVHDVDVQAIIYNGDVSTERQSHDLVQVLTLAKDVSFEPGEKALFQHSGGLSKAFAPGEYHISIYARASGAFDMFGVPPGGGTYSDSLAFTVEGDGPRAVYFDRNDINVAEMPYRIQNTSFTLPGESFNEKVIIEVGIKNGSKYTAARGTVLWQLYEGNEARLQNVTSLTEEEIRLVPGSGTTLVYTFENTSEEGYLLVGTLKPDDGNESMVVIRLPQPFESEIASNKTLAYVGITEYPARNGSSEAFACFDGNLFYSSDIKVELTIKAQDGTFSDIVQKGFDNTVTYKSHGDSGSNQLYALTLPFDADTNSFSVIAKLYNEDKLIDAIEVQYTCNDYAEACGSNIAKLISVKNASTSTIATVTVLSLLVLLIIFISLRRRHDEPPIDQSTNNETENHE